MSKIRHRKLKPEAAPMAEADTVLNCDSSEARG